MFLATMEYCEYGSVQWACAAVEAFRVTPQEGALLARVRPECLRSNSERIEEDESQRRKPLAPKWSGIFRLPTLLPWSRSSDTTSRVTKWPLHLVHILLNCVPTTQAAPNVHYCNATSVPMMSDALASVCRSAWPPRGCDMKVQYVLEDEADERPTRGVERPVLAAHQQLEQAADAARRACSPAAANRRRGRPRSR